jgi:hypothetical protein
MIQNSDAKWTYQAPRWLSFAHREGVIGGEEESSWQQLEGGRLGFSVGSREIKKEEKRARRCVVGLSAR